MAWISAEEFVRKHTALQIEEEYKIGLKSKKKKKENKAVKAPRANYEAFVKVIKEKSLTRSEVLKTLEVDEDLITKTDFSTYLYKARIKAQEEGYGIKKVNDKYIGIKLRGEK